MFTHLHFHSSFSFLDGYNPIDKAVARVKELGMKACAITDHNHIGGVPIWQEECQKQGIKPLLGMEGYFTLDMHEAAKPVDERKKDATQLALEAGVLPDDYKKMKKSELNELIKPFMYDMHQYHILYIAKNQTGWNNLVKLQSESARLCTYNGRYLADMELIRKYHEGLICTTACIGSFPSKCVQQGDFDSAEAYIQEMQDIFGEDFYLEIQPLNIDKQITTNLFYMTMEKKYDIQLIATNDVHYTRKEDWDDHDTLLCIGTKKLKSDTDRMRYSHDFWIKSEEEMYDSFQAQDCAKSYMSEEEIEEYRACYEQAIQNTQLVADKVEENIKLGSDKPLFSKVKVPGNFSPEDWLTLKAYRGLYKYLVKHPECDIDEYIERLAEELDIINPKGFAPYMLAVEEYVSWANAHGCPTGPGRGSAAGSLVLFCIGVTKNIDPIKNKLWFSRFLTADRKDPPDIDVDLEYTHRDDVVHHLEDYYGKECVAHIGTYSEMGVKSGIKDVGRVLEIDFKTVNDITKKIAEINDSPGLTFKDLDEMKDGDDNEQKAWQSFHELEEANTELFRLARAFEGTPRNQGVHASGILVTPMPITDMFPVRYKDGVAIALYTGPQLEHQGAVKYDLLGLRNLSIIQKTINHIDDIESIEDLYSRIDLNDKNIWKYISNKQTDGVFQIESNMMKGIIDEIQPTEFNDLVAINSLGRPGPLGANMPHDYSVRKNRVRSVTYPIKGCEDILDETYGVIPYQEQLMAISKRIAGFDDMQADSLTRKTIA